MKPGFKIDQRYEVVKELGDGLSGEVLLVKDGQELKALKFLKKVQRNVSREDALKNFKREFEILKELNHPNINRILDFGFDERIQKYYFTNEFISGKEFYEACKDQPLAVIEKLIVQVLRALNYLHSRGIYHFDIKPQNILVTMDQNTPLEAKIIDFGLAGFHSPNQRVGTPTYMAPEVIQGGILDGRTDLYSFGILIYKTLTDSNPFARKNLKETLNLQLKHQAAPPSSVKENLPKYWDHIVGRLLKKRPAKRYSQASLVIRDLNFLSGHDFEVETRDTKLSYLPQKGTLIGRDQEWENFVNLFENIFSGEELPRDRLLIIEGHKGSGKTRLLSEIKYFAQLRSVATRELSLFETEDEHASQFIVLIDDPHVEADRVNALAQELASQKSLIVWATEAAPQNWADAHVVTLKNYSKPELKQYLESVTGLPSAPEKLIKEVYSRTAGNPLFVTEFIKSLLEQGHLFDQSGKWNAKTFEDITIDFDHIHIPSNVDDYLKEKYQKLSADKQTVIHWIAANGRSLPQDKLKEFSQVPDFQTTIDELTTDDVLEVFDDDSIGFKSLLFTEVAYKFIEPKQRQNLHDKLSELYQNSDDKKTLYLYHLGHGSQQDLAKKSLLELAKIHFNHAKYQDSKLSLETALNLCENLLDELSTEIRFELGKTLIASREYTKAYEHFNQLYNELKSQTHHQQHLIRCLEKLVDLSIKIMKLDQALELCQLAKETAQNSSKEKIYGMIFDNYQAYVLIKQNKIEEAQEIYLKTNKEWHHDFNEDEKQKVENNRLIEVYLLKKENEKAIQTCLTNISMLKKTDNKRQLAMNHYALGDVYYRCIIAEKRADQEELTQKCIKSFETCESLSRDINDYGMMLRAFNGLGNLYTHTQENQKALDYYNRALTISRKTEELFTAALISYNIGRIHTDAKNDSEAYAYLIYAINTLEGLKQQYSPHAELNLYFAYNSLAEVYLQTHEVTNAHEALDKSDKIFTEVDILKSMEFWKVIRRAQTYFAGDDTEKGEGFLTQAKELVTSEDEKSELETVTAIIKTYSQPKAEKTEPEIREGVRVMSSQNTSANQNENLKKIIEINKFINSQYDTDQLLKVVLNYAIQLSNAESGFVLLLDENDSFEITESMNTKEEDADKISMSIARSALETGEIISSSDALSDDRFDTSESIVLNELKSVLCLPIKSKNKSIGVFYLDNRFRINAFEECDVDLLNAFCDQVGIALENNQLIHDLQEAQKNLKGELEKTTEELAEVKNILKEESQVYQTRYAYKHILSQSDTMQSIFKILDKVTETTLSVFIHGESGTGKELIAKALHYNNPVRNQKRFIAINCGAIPANLMESELFGYKAGSFTGADKDKKGLFEEADGGTLFFDEIGELDAQLQVKLLRVLQEGEVQRLGASQTVRVDVRIVCASHKDMEDLAKQGKFREDLFYRLCQMKIDLPPLRDRNQDIPLLAKHFVEKYCEQNGIKEKIQIPPVFMKALLQYNWPGNIRELENLISVACALKDGDNLSLDNIPPNYGLIKNHQDSNQTIHDNLADINSSQVIKTVSIDDDNTFDPGKTWRDYESVILAKCYEANNKKKMPTAQCLKQSHSTIYKKISDLNLDDTSNPLYADDFVYNQSTNMKQYIVKIFKAALEYHDDHPYAAIKQLGVSQGYFYKIMKEFKKGSQEAATA